MKHIYYTLVSGFICYLALILPLDSKAQCSTCPGGEPMMTIEHYLVLDTTTNSSNTLSFPQFPMATGTLYCVNFYDTISLVAVSGVRNRNSESKLAAFLLSLSPNITGNGLNIYDNRKIDYGPSLLDAFGLPADSVTYGPDTVFNNKTHQQSVSAGSAYLGSGTVSFLFEISGGLTPEMGGINYNLSVMGKLWGRFRLVYSYCPAASLPEIFKQFTAVKLPNNTIRLDWSVTNEEISNSYEIEISYDGRTFTPAGKIAGQYAAQGAAAKYHYQYLPDKAAAGKLYFRVKQLNANGQGRYSPIRQVGLGNTSATFITWPNPVNNQINLQADQLLKGTYLAELVSSSGQLVMKRTVQVANQSIIQLTIPPGITSGLYYLRTREAGSGQSATYKVMVNR